MNTILSGCATSASFGDPAQAEKLKNFSPSPDEVQVYVCRKPGIVGAAVTSSIELNGEGVANLNSGAFAHTKIVSGTHEIVSVSPEHRSVLSFTAKNGEIRYFETWIVPGVFSGRSIIEEADSQAGQACVKSGSLVVKKM